MFSSQTSATTPPEFDFLIVGHGLAGAVLEQELSWRGQRVAVIDDLDARSASQVAAGLINPITGHRLNITEGFAEFSQQASDFYHAYQGKTGCTVFNSVKQIRLLKNAGQRRYYEKRREESAYEGLLGEFREHATHFKEAACGELEIKQSGVVNTRALIDLSRAAIAHRGALRDALFEHGKLSVSPAGFNYQGLTAKRVVFCEGHAAIQNPWLNKLPFKLSKGEILNLSSNNPTAPYLNWGHWQVIDPTSGAVRVGASYQWHDLALNSTQSDPLLASAKRYTDAQAKVLSVDVGIRPTTKYRKPFVGEINTLRGAYCFNGFGSKGCLLIPYYAKLLVSHMMAGADLPQDITQWL